MLGPVFWMELHTRSRRRRLFAARALGTAGLSLVLLVIYFNFYYSRQPTMRMVRTANGGTTWVQVTPEPGNSGQPQSLRRLAMLGEEMFRAYSVGQFALLLLIAPVYCAGCIAGDRERRVLEMVFLSRLSNVEIVAGKFLVRLLELCMLGTTGLPALFLCLLLGGVSWQGLLSVGAVTLATITVVASVALLVSIVAARVLTAVVLTYMTLLLVWAGIPVVMLMRYSGVGPPTTGITGWALTLNPAMAILSAVSPMFGPGGNPWSDSYLWCIGVYSATTVLLLLLALLVLRPVGLWASRERVPKAKRRDRKAASRRVWNNPVAWREVKTIAVHRRMRWARILVLLLLIMVSTPLWVTFLVDWLEGGRAMAHDIHTYTAVITMTAVLAWLLMTLQGSMSFAYERDRSTLDALLTTPLSGRQIVLGKLAGVLRSSAFALAVPLMFIGMAVWHQVISTRAAVLGIIVVLVASLLSASWGLLCSISTATTVKAATYAFLIALGLLVGVPLLNTMALSVFLQYDLLPVTFMSPALNLDYGLFEGLNGSQRIFRGYESMPNWDERLWMARFHLAIDCVLALVAIYLGIRRVDRWHRVAGVRRVQSLLTKGAVERPVTA